MSSLPTFAAVSLESASHICLYWMHQNIASLLINFFPQALADIPPQLLTRLR